MSLLAVFPTLGEFLNYTGPLPKRTKERSRITKSSNYSGIFVRIIELSLLENSEGHVQFC